MSGSGNPLSRLEAAELAVLTAKAAAAPHSEAATIYCQVALECVKNARRVLEFDLKTGNPLVIQEKAA